MGGFDFEWKGKLYIINTEGGYPFFETDEEEAAFNEWRPSPEGIQLFGPVPKDWESTEHYLEDRYPWDSERDCRVDVEDVGKDKKNKSSNSGGGDMYDSDDEDYYNEPNIDWASYDKCRFNCYRHFYIASDTHECALCGVISCKECAKGSFKKCSGKDCSAWVCGCDCVCCDYCEQLKEVEEEGEEECGESKKRKKKSSG